jgi:tripartite-type tricarboxylate transporter receptor subunit TctC
VPEAPGGGKDRVARLIRKSAQKEKLHTAVPPVERKPGAGVVMGPDCLNQRTGGGHFVALVSPAFPCNYAWGRSALGPDDSTPIAPLFAQQVAFAMKTDSPGNCARDVLARLKLMQRACQLR